MTAEEIAAVAATVRTGGISEDLNRWAKMTPAALEVNEAARAAARKEKETVHWRSPMADKPGSTKEQRLREMRETAAKTAADAPAPAKPTKESNVDTKKTTKTRKAAKAAPPKQTSTEQPWKPGTIGAVAREAILAGKSNEEALKAVKKKFPDGNTNQANMAWYRNDLRKRGLLGDGKEAA